MCTVALQQMRQQKACLQLSTDLRLQGVTVFGGFTVFTQPRLPVHVQTGKGQGAGDLEYACILLRLVKNVLHRIEKARQEDATRFQHAEGLAPDGPHIRHEVIRHRMKHEVEALVSKPREVRHIALDGCESKMVPLSNKTVMLKLLP